MAAKVLQLKDLKSCHPSKEFILNGTIPPSIHEGLPSRTVKASCSGRPQKLHFGRGLFREGISRPASIILLQLHLSSWLWLSHDHYNCDPQKDGFREERERYGIMKED